MSCHAPDLRNRKIIFMRPKNWNALLAGIVLTPIPFAAAQAETYLTDSQAAAIFFPGVTLQAKPILLSPDQIKTIYKASGEKPLSPEVKWWQGPSGETMIVDQVVGKHEFITYAVGFTPEGAVKGVEILDYRETYGYQVREKEWRQRFVGKTAKDPVKLDKDIPNISGATLSSKHVTDGVRRLLKTYDLLKTKA
jgi:hypothetical protein